MINYVDLANNKNRRLFSLKPSLTKDDYVEINQVKYGFSEECFSDFVPDSYSITKLSDVVNDSIVYSSEVAFRIGNYLNLTTANYKLSEGLASLLVEGNTPSTFSIDGYEFSLVEYGSTAEAGKFPINISSTTEATAKNIASVVTSVCPRISAVSSGSCVVFKEAYSGTGLNGNVSNIIEILVASVPKESIELTIGDWLFVASLSNVSSCDEESKIVRFYVGTDLVTLRNNFVKAFNDFSSQTGLGFAKLSGTSILLYMCSLTTEAMLVSPFESPAEKRFFKKIANQDILDVPSNSTSLKKLELYNIYANGTEVTPQIAAGLFASSLRYLTSNIEINSNDSINVYLKEDSYYPINSYSTYIKSDFNEGSSVYAIMDKCLSHLSSELNSAGIESYIYSSDSVDVITESSSFVCSGNISIIEMGSDIFPSTEEEPMSTNDFDLFITKNYELGTVVFLDTTDYEQSSPVVQSFTFNNDVRATFTTKLGKYLRLSNTLFNFSNSNVDLNLDGLQISWDSSSQSNAMLNFNKCKGRVSILNNEICFRNSGSFVSINNCIDFNLYNQHSSYLIESTSSFISVFSINNSAINLLSKYNVIDAPDVADGYFYERSSSAVVSLERKDIFSSNSPSFNLDSYLPIEDISVRSEGPYRKLLCGLEDSYITINTFSLTCDSLALNADFNRKVPNDIYGRYRGLKQSFGKSVLRLNNVFEGINDLSYVKINSDIFYVKSFVEHNIDHIEEFLEAIREIVSYKSDYKITWDKDGNGYVIVVHGNIVSIELSNDLQSLVDIYYTDIEGNEDSDDNKNRYQGCIDFGSRQKNTFYDVTFYVDTEKDHSKQKKGEIRNGTNQSDDKFDDMFTCTDMIKWCMSMYPRFGNTTFILKSKSVGDLVTSVNLNIANVSELANLTKSSIMYGNVTLKSTMLGVRAVPVLKHVDSVTAPLFNVGCHGASNIIFENIMLVSTYQVLNVPDGVNGDDSYSTFGIEFRNCILKNYHESNPVVNYNSSSLKIVESTIVDSGIDSVTDCLIGTGVYKIEASIVGSANVPTSVATDKPSVDERPFYNVGFYKYNYRIDLKSDNGSYDDDGNYTGNNCLMDSAFDSYSEDTFSIENFRIDDAKDDNKAKDFIPSVYNLALYNPTVMFDIGGRYRYNEVSKVSLDVGAIETDDGLVEPTIQTFYVSLGHTSEMNYAGKLRYISWEDFKHHIENLDEIKNVYKVHLSGYGVNKEPIHLREDVSFFEQARIEFYADNECVYEGSSFFKADCDYVNIAISGLVIRIYKNGFELGKKSNLIMTNCFVLSKNAEYGDELYHFSVGENSSIQMFSCTLMSSNSYTLFKTSDSFTYKLAMLGCVAQGYNSESKFGYNGSILTSIDGGLLWNSFSDLSSSEDCGYRLVDYNLIYKDYLKSSDAKLLQEPDDRFALYHSDMDNSDVKKAIEVGMKYNWNTDIAGNYRELSFNPYAFPTKEAQKEFYADNNKFTSLGCYDSKSVDVSKYYADKPNREVTCITEIGRTMITRMLSNSVRFQIEGFGICADGYSYDNPVMASSIREDVTRARISYRVNDSMLNAGEEDTIKVGNSITLYARDFLASSTKSIANNIVNAINKVKYIDNDLSNNSSFYAISNGDDTFVVEKLMPEVTDEKLVCSLENGIEEIDTVSPVNDVNYNNNQVLPKEGFNKFDTVEYLPLAISMYYRINRGTWNGGFGSEVVYARIVESTNQEEVNSIFPLCVCHHGLITKSNDSFIVGRIILQI